VREYISKECCSRAVSACYNGFSIALASQFFRLMNVFHVVVFTFMKSSLYGLENDMLYMILFVL